VNPFNISSRSDMEQSVRVEFERIIASNPLFAGLIQNLSTQGRLVIFGGFVRDRIHNVVHRDKLHSRDIDLVLCGTLKDSPDEVSQTNFGGQRRQIDGELKVDYWELQKTYAFRRGLFEPKLENLPLTTVYTVNACFFDLSDGRLVEHGAVRDITNRVIAFNCAGYLDAFPEYQAFRAMDLAHRLEYQLDVDVRTFVRSRMDQSTPEEFLLAVHKHRKDVTSEDVGKMYREYSS
jgi:hypothetical protein